MIPHCLAKLYFATEIACILILLFYAAHELHLEGVTARVHCSNGHVHLQDEQGGCLEENQRAEHLPL